MFKISVIEARTSLGLKSPGVENAPEALIKAGIIKKLGGNYGGVILPIDGHKKRFSDNILDAAEVRQYANKLGDKIWNMLMRDQFPVVLGGDCSIVLGTQLASKFMYPDPLYGKLKDYGLFFMDGHADFYSPQTSPTGEVADMDLYFATGHGPDILSNIMGFKPLVQEERVALFGYRDREASIEDGCQDPAATKMHTYALAKIKSMGAKNAAQDALNKLKDLNVHGVWIHLDADVLDDAIMPAVDYRMPGGLIFEELSEVLNVVLSSGMAVGLDICIYNPKYDQDRSIAKNLVDTITQGFQTT